MAEQTRQPPVRQQQTRPQAAGRAAAGIPQSPEQLAYRLMVDISKSERSAVKDRKWILDTYAECLLAVRDPKSRVRD